MTNEVTTRLADLAVEYQPVWNALQRLTPWASELFMTECGRGDEKVGGAVREPSG